MYTYQQQFLTFNKVKKKYIHLVIVFFFFDRWKTKYIDQKKDQKATKEYTIGIQKGPDGGHKKQ